MSEGHAKYSPSGASRWMACPGSIQLSDGLPDTSSSFADEGTVAHWVAADCLRNAHDADVHTGRTFGPDDDVGIQSRVKFTADLAESTQVYIDQIRNAAHGHQLLVEQQIDFSEVVKEADQFGTGDAIIIEPRRLQVRDLKFGRGVKVDAEGNEQLLIYGLGKLRELEALGFEFDELLIAIHQPRLDHLDEWTVGMAALAEFEQRLQDAVEATKLPEPILNPGAKQCRFCKAKAICPAIRDRVEAVTQADFDDLTAQPPTVLVDSTDLLSQQMAAVDLVESWCKAVRAETEARLLDGQDIPGWKLVAGRKGARAWQDEDAATAELKAMRLKVEEMFNLKLISPAQAEKLLKKSPRRWARVAGMVTQAEGKPSVAPESDKRPAYSVADDFDDCSKEQ